MNLLMLYYTKTGHTLEAINATAEGIRSAGSTVELVRTGDFEPGSVSGYDGLIVGSPCWAGSITPGGVAMPVARALNALSDGTLTGKRCGGISVHCAIGGLTTIRTLGLLLARRGCEDYRPGPAAKAGVAFSVIKGPSVSEADESRFMAYGAAFIGQ